MKNILLMICISGVMLGGCAPQVDVEAELSAIRDADRDWERATDESGVDGWLSYVADDAVIFPPDAPIVRGTEAIAEHMGRLISPDQSVSWQPDKLEVSAAGDMAYMFGTFEIGDRDEQGNAIVTRGKYGNAWNKLADGSWKVVASGWSVEAPQGGAGQSLYQRLGGYDTLVAILDDLAPRVGGDPEFSEFFVNMDEAAGKRGRELALDHLCEAAGGPCAYIGPELKAIHAGLGITDEHWQLFIGHVENTLDDLNIEGEERGELLAIYAGIKHYIVDSAVE